MAFHQYLFRCFGPLSAALFWNWASKSEEPEKSQVRLRLTRTVVARVVSDGSDLCEATTTKIIDS